MDALFNNLCKVLVEHDPMMTCCKENECYDEYDFIAAKTIALIEQGDDFKVALNSVLSASFTKSMADNVDYVTIENDFNKLKQ